MYYIFIYLYISIYLYIVNIQMKLTIEIHVDSREPQDVSTTLQSIIDGNEVMGMETGEETKYHSIILNRTIPTSSPIKNDEKKKDKWDRWKEKMNVWKEQGIEINIVSKSLPLGDYHIYCGNQCAMVLERKQGSDFWNSVYDGRMDQQSLRLREWLETCPGTSLCWILQEMKHDSTRHQYEEATWKYIAQKCIQASNQEHILWMSEASQLYHFLCGVVDRLITMNLQEQKPVIFPEIQHALAMMKSKKQYQTENAFLSCVVSIIPGISSEKAGQWYTSFVTRWNQSQKCRDMINSEEDPLRSSILPKELTMMTFCEWLHSFDEDGKDEKTLKTLMSILRHDQILSKSQITKMLHYFGKNI